jgi:hypothetical protein
MAIWSGEFKVTPEKLNLPGLVARYFIESKLTVLMMLAWCIAT